MGQISELSGEEIVISGISGIFPLAENVHKFKENLYNKVDMVEKSETYWDFQHPDVPKYVGRLQNLEYFDASFFKVPRSQGKALDVMSRKLLEQTYCALLDAGINPLTLSGHKTSVFVGSSYADIVYLNMFDEGHKKHSRYLVSGGSKSLLANRISYWLNVTGPSHSVDSGCASAATCLAAAYNNMRRGHCDSAIVAACNHCPHPVLAANLKRAGYVCVGGETKCFDKNSDGAVRAEAVSVFFLQKAKDAKRIYAEVIHISEQYFMKPDTLFLPMTNKRDNEEFLNNFYKNAEISPNCVEYVEGHGTAVIQSDAAELETIGNIFAKDHPVLVGSVKSNMGHAESAAAACSLAKICLAYQTGKIAANLHYKDPIDITAVKEGRVQIVTENTDFNRGFIALNASAIGGLNYHVLMKGHFKLKDITKYSASIPRIVLASGRTDESVKHIFDLLKSSHFDPEQIALLHDFYNFNISGHLSRGYAILDSKSDNTTECLSESASRCPDAGRPLWFVFSGMGSQWPGMGADLMRIPIFAAAIHKCQTVLLPKGVDVVKIITSPDEKFENILHCFVGITAIQIGLTDVLEEIGIIPDFIIGHSLGEIACGYSDGSLTAEEAILLTYYRGLVSLETPFVRGLMAAVKLSPDEVASTCPPEVEVACRNSSESTTISGPEDVVTLFVRELQSRGIFAKVVPTGNIAYHSKYIAHAGPRLLFECNKVIPMPKLRSYKWVSTSVPPRQRESSAAKFASSEYFTNNMLGSVYFQEASQEIKGKAIVVEIAPHGLLQAIVRASLPECAHVPLTRRAHRRPVDHFLEAVGKLYQEGLNPRVSALYPKVEYPVSTETPLLSHFVAWEHNDKWSQCAFERKEYKVMMAREIAFNMQDLDFKYLQGIKRNGENVLPESVLLVHVWETLALYKGLNYKDMSVTFKNLKFHRDVVITNLNEVIRYTIVIQKGNNHFEVTIEGLLILDGIIYSETERNLYCQPSTQNSDKNSAETLNKEEIYKLLDNKGYYYGDKIQLMEELNPNLCTAKIKWTGNFGLFFESLIQVHIIALKQNRVAKLKFLRKLKFTFKPYISEGDYIDIEFDIADFATRLRGVCINIEDVVFEHDITRDFDQKIYNYFNEQRDFNVEYVGLWRNNMQNNKINQFTDEKIIPAVDFSGWKTNGERIMGILTQNSTRDLYACSELQWLVPRGWSLEEAASVVLPYIHAYYALNVRGGLYENYMKRSYPSTYGKNKSILITNVADSFGEAAVAVALEAGFEVFTTVSSDDQKQALLNSFPQLNENNVFISADEQFYYNLVQSTDTALVNIVLNSFNGVQREYALKCVAPEGAFIDISQDDIKENSDFGLSYLFQCKHYISVCLPYLFREEGHKDRQIVSKLFTEGVEKQTVKPFKNIVCVSEDVKNITYIDDNVDRVLIKKRHIDILHNDDDLKIMCTDSLSNIDPSSTKAQEPVLGFDAFFSYIDKNEMDAIDGLVEMPTMLRKSSTKREGEIDKEGHYLLMIPGFEGHSRVFKSICEKIKIQALSTQTVINEYCFNSFKADISAIAKDAFSQIKNTFKIKTKFYLVGYSFGVNVALELAALIESEDELNDNEKSIDIQNIVDRTNFLDHKVKANISEGGLNAFFSFIDKNEMNATNSLVEMPTILRKISPLLAGEINDEANYLIMIPRFEGHSQVFQSICKSIKIRALSMQTAVNDCCLESVGNNIIDIVAKDTLFHINYNITLKSPFYIFGYSFGVNTALELASLLEQQGVDEDSVHWKFLNLRVKMSETTLSGEEVVISGMSGIYPASKNVQIFMKNLYNKVDMVEPSDTYWDYNHPDVPKYVGKLDDVASFDSHFFKVPWKNGMALEVMSRKLLEQTFSALLCAGVNPSSMAGTNTAVYVGSSYSDATNRMYDKSCNKTSWGRYIVSGSSKTMLANRISYWLDLKGPSLAVDTNCSSSSSCLMNAYRNIKGGYCDSAIVAASNICHHPVLSVNLNKSGYVTNSGQTKCFDKNSDGAVRSEAITVFYLQKAKHANRIYAEVYHAHEKYFMAPDNRFLPATDQNEIEIFLKECYNQTDVSPNEVEYIEANGAAIKESDGPELEAIGNVFAKNRTVLVGSVKSNMGSAESASGLCSLTKICLAYHTGEIAGSIYYKEPLDIKAITEGRIRVVTDNTKFNRGIIALNSFSLSGMNCHILLKGHYKSKDLTKYACSFPRLVVASGRINESVQYIFDVLKQSHYDPEQIGLLHNFFQYNIFGHLSRGYAILNTDDANGTKFITQSVAQSSDERRPVWFLFSGMGSQWAGMGADLMRIPVFAASIEKCHRVLYPKGIDIVKVITDPNESFDNILHCFVGIGAVQIGLVDILSQLGIIPDKVIGHSVGEIACAYSDGAITAEQAILLSYYRGVVALETPFIRGLMAAVKLSYEEVLLTCPPEIEAACHNSSESTTISGPEDIVKDFVKQLTDRGIFAREVSTANIAFHSRYIKQAGPRLLSECEKVIPEPKLRSSKWISTSVAPHQIDSTASKYASSEYFTNNLLGNVLFQEASKQIESNAIVVEIAPHGLLQAIVRKSLSECIHVPLTRRGHASPINHLLDAVGKLYEFGLNPRVSALYPQIEYPVSTETPLLSPLVVWEHAAEWQVISSSRPDYKVMKAREVAFSFQDSEFKYLQGIRRNGKYVLSESVLLMNIWETLALFEGQHYTTMPVTFKDIKFHQEVALNEYETADFNIDVRRGDNYFEVTIGGKVIVSGIVYDTSEYIYNTPGGVSNPGDIILKKDEIYKLLAKKGYTYSNDFQLIESVNLTSNKANIKWTGDCIRFIESLIQLQVLTKCKHSGASRIKHIRGFIFDFKAISKQECCYEIKFEVEEFRSRLKGSHVIMEDVVFEHDNSNIEFHQQIRKFTRDQEEFKIAYFGLPHAIYQNTCKLTDDDAVLALDFSGWKRNGDKVMGVMFRDVTSPSAALQSDLLWPVPDNWSLEDAATALMPYIYAYYCLAVRCTIHDINKDKTFLVDDLNNKAILITDAGDAFTQAAVSVCLDVDYVVYATVRSEEKKHTLLKLFPQLEGSNIVVATNETFYFTLLHETENKMFSVVLNSYTGVMREHASKCVMDRGLFIDVSRQDMKENVPFRMSYLEKDRNYVTVHFQNLFRKEYCNQRKIIYKHISEGISKQVVKPLNRVVCDVKDVSNTDNVADKISFERVLIDVRNYRAENGDEFKEKDTLIDAVNDADIIHGQSQKNITKPTREGFHALFSYIEKNEMKATNSLVEMGTMMTKMSRKLVGEIDYYANYLIMIPGFEGHSQIFKSMCKKIKIQVFSMQTALNDYCLGYIGNNVMDMAKDTYFHINHTFKLKSPFYILGYSFGVNIALELASLIEKEGHTGVIFCLDSSPDVLQAQVAACLGTLTDEQLQHAILTHLYTLITGKGADELQIKLQNIDTWEEKVDQFIRSIRSNTTHTSQYMRQIADSLYNKMVLIQDYTPDTKLKSEIVLIKGAPNRQTDNDDDYGLSKYSEKPIKIYHIYSDHASAPFNCELPDIINQTVDPILIQEFKNKNGCMFYQQS